MYVARLLLVVTDTKTLLAFSFKGPLAVKSTPTLLWSLTSVEQYSYTWTVSVAKWKVSWKKLVLSLRKKDWKHFQKVRVYELSECLVAGPVGKLLIRKFAKLQAGAFCKYTSGLMRHKILSPKHITK